MQIINQGWLIGFLQRSELTKASIETLTNVLEDCIYTKGDKIVEALLMAKALAEKIGGKAILELI